MTYESSDRADSKPPTLASSDQTALRIVGESPAMRGLLFEHPVFDGVTAPVRRNAALRMWTDDYSSLLSVLK